MLCDVSRGEANGSGNRSRASGDPTLQSLVADAGAFLYGHAVRSGKQNVRCLDAYQLEGAIGCGKRKVESPASIRKGVESEVTDSDLRVLQYISPRDSAARRRSLLWKILFPHPLQRGTDQVAIGLEQSRWNPGKLGFDSLRAILEHSGVFDSVLLRDDV